MSKFKVGDKVKVVSLGKTVGKFGHGNNMISVGDTSFIKEVLVDGGVNLTDEYTYHEDDLELVSEPPTQSEEQPTKLYNPLFAQEGGGHYKNRGIQPIEYSEANNLGIQIPSIKLLKEVTQERLKAIKDGQVAQQAAETTDPKQQEKRSSTN